MADKSDFAVGRRSGEITYLFLQMHESVIRLNTVVDNILKREAPVVGKRFPVVDRPISPHCL